MSRWLALSLLVLTGCGEEPQSAVTPLPSSGVPARAAVAEPPSPLIAAPHLRRVEHGDAPPPTPAPTGSGGGSAERRPPTEREIDAFRDRLRREVADNVDPEDDPCEQHRGVIGATLGEDPPSRAAMREHCRDLPDASRQCLAPAYFREHAEECQAEMERMTARGRRQTEQAQRELDSMERGEMPWPGQRQAPTPRQRDPEDG